MGIVDRMLERGTIIDGRFEILDFIGEGGMGDVYSATHKQMDRAVALKLIKSHLVAEHEKVARFRNEARILSGLEHPNIIAVHAVGITEGGQPYMAMELLQGESVSDVLRKRGPFEPREALQIAIQICGGLGYAHQRNVIHRDIKPSNIILIGPEDKRVAKVVDFGIAKALDAVAGALTATGVAVGSVFYLSPGQVEGRAADPASDVYSLGCTLYEMLAGVPPFVGETTMDTLMQHTQAQLVPIKKRNPKASVSDDLQRVINRMLERESTKRYSDMTVLQRDLELVLQGRPPENGGELKAGTPIRVSKRVLLVGAACLIGLGAGAYFTILHPHGESKEQVYAQLHAFINKLQSPNATNSRELSQQLLPEGEALLSKCDATGDPVLIFDAYESYLNLSLSAGGHDPKQLFELMDHARTAVHELTKKYPHSFYDNKALETDLRWLYYAYNSGLIPAADEEHSILTHIAPLAKQPVVAAQINLTMDRALVTYFENDISKERFSQFLQSRQDVFREMGLPAKPPQDRDVLISKAQTADRDDLVPVINEAYRQ